MSTTQCVSSFSKTMVSSSVTNFYYLTLPKEFCDKHLPRHNNPIILVGESEREYNLLYLVNRNRVRGGGWRDFVITHRLLEGDELSFHLIDECKFQVHIVRASRSVENEFQNNKLVDLVKLEGLIEENAYTGNTSAQKQQPASHMLDSYQEMMLCGIQKRVHEEVVPKEMMNQLKLALSSQYFSFCKKMGRTYLYRSELRIPKEFCDAHLPYDCNTVILVDESQREYNVTYTVKGYSLLGGWSGFAVACGLLEGDIVVFQLVDRCKFKVHVIRANGSIQKEFQNSKLLNFVKGEELAEENALNGNTVAEKNPVPRAADSLQVEKKSLKRGNVDVVPFEKVYVRRKYRSTETCDTHPASPLESELNFNHFEDFRIRVNGETLDSEIPADIRMKYYELCCVQKRCLHDNVTKDLSTKLVASMIRDIVSIAESIKATSISTRIHHLESMDKTLKSFENSGMTAGSLRAKIGKLIKILNEHHSVAESTIVRLEALECERNAFMDKKRRIDELITSAMAHGKMIGRLEEIVDGSKEKMDNLSLMLKEVAGFSQ